MSTAVESRSVSELVDLITSKFPEVGLRTCRRIIDQKAGSLSTDEQVEVTEYCMKIGNFMQQSMSLSVLAGSERDAVMRHAIKKVIDDEDRKNLALVELAIVVGSKLISSHISGWRPAAEKMVAIDSGPDGEKFNELQSGIEAMIAAVPG